MKSVKSILLDGLKYFRQALLSDTPVQNDSKHGLTLAGAYALQQAINGKAASNVADGCITSISRSGTTFTATKKNGTTFTFSQQDDDTTYSGVTTSAAGLCPKLASGTTKFLRADGTWQVPPDNNSTYPDAVKSISRSGTTFTATRYSGGTFTFSQQDNNTTYSAATTSAAGLMSAADKTKLNAVDTIISKGGSYSMSANTTTNSPAVSVPAGTWCIFFNLAISVSTSEMTGAQLKIGSGVHQQVRVKGAAGGGCSGWTVVTLSSAQNALIVGYQGTGSTVTGYYNIQGFRLY